MKHTFYILMIGAVLCSFRLSSAAAQTADDAASADQVPAAPSEAGSMSPAESASAEPATGDASMHDASAAEPAAIETRRTAKNGLFVELAGNAGIYSLNYERFFTDDIAARIGFGYISLSATSGGSSANASVLFVPLMASYMGIGSADHKLELGIGPLFVNASAGVSGVGSSAASASGFAVAGTATIGYRYVPHDGGFNFKVGFTPIFGEGGFLPWGGLGLGAVF